jgi:uncharacterized protein (DUF2062 family)
MWKKGMPRKSRPLGERLRRAFRYILKQRGSPESIALGASIGVFLAFTPTVGLQMILAAVIATLLGASRAAAIPPVWITNPLTIPPIYAFTYGLGKWIVGGPPASEVAERLACAVQDMESISPHEILDLFRAFLRVGTGAFAAMGVGGALVGGILAIASYPAMLIAVRRFRNLRERLRHLRFLERRRARKRRRSSDDGPTEDDR